MNLSRTLTQISVISPSNMREWKISIWKKVNMKSCVCCCCIQIRPSRVAKHNCKQLICLIIETFELGYDYTFDSLLQNVVSIYQTDIPIILFKLTLQNTLHHIDFIFSTARNTKITHIIQLKWNWMWLLRIVVRFVGGTKSVRNNTSNILKMSQNDVDIYIGSD